MNATALRRHFEFVMWSSRPMPRRLQLLLAVLLLGCPVVIRAAPADAPPSSAQAPISVRERILRMTEFLDTMLPGTLGEHNVTLHFTPKFSDVRDNQFIRYPLEVRYGATDRLEFVTGLNPFGPNPIKSGRDHRWGPGEVKLGAKYDLPDPLLFYDGATVGLETRVPIGKPPIELNDHYTHVRPFLAASRILRSNPDTTFYTNFSYDRSVKLTHRESPPPEVVRRHVAEVAPGFLYKPDELGYFVEYRFQHIQEPTDWHLAHEGRIGSIWDVPLRRTAEWHLPGKWQLELALKYRTEQGYKDDFGVSARVNWRTTLREVLDHVSNLSNGGAVKPTARP
jgi:hypothetical protein